MTNRTLGEQLRRAREQQGLSLYALAQQSGVTRSLIWKLEQGQVNDPRPETVSKVAQALGLSLTDLYTEAGYANVEQLPTLRRYLRAKYGHLPAAKRNEVARYFEQLEQEYGSAKRRTTKTPRKKGGAS